MTSKLISAVKHWFVVSLSPIILLWHDAVIQEQELKLVRMRLMMFRIITSSSAWVPLLSTYLSIWGDWKLCHKQWLDMGESIEAVCVPMRNEDWVEAHGPNVGCPFRYW